MAIVRSFGALQSVQPSSPTWAGVSAGSVNLYTSHHSYADIYRTNPNVRTCADFLAFNVAQVGLHVFRRVSGTDRVRLPDHELAQWLERPNPWTTRFRLFEGLMQDLAVYSNAYWVKVRTPGQIGLLRLPPAQMHVEGDLYPSSFVRTTEDGRHKEFAPSEIVYFRWSVGFDPDRMAMGLSRLDTLQRILAEEAAAGVHRESFWANAARIEGVVTRPKEMKRYTKEQADSWREQYQAIYAGGAGSGKTLLLQDGETFTPTAWSAKESEYVASRKLAREEYASSNHIPQPFVGILDHATFSNIREQHKHLYQDTLGPPLKMIEEDIEQQLLIECADQRDVYTEFNIAEKLKGTFEEQAAAIQMSTGRPWRTVNEARALENLPRIDDPAMDTVAPQQGGPATTADAEPEPSPAPVGEDAIDSAAVATVIQASQARQQARLEKLPVADRAAYFDVARWNRELTEDLTSVVGAAQAARIAVATNAETVRRLQQEATSARVEALERRPVPRPAVRRSFERDPTNGLVTAFTDAPIEENT